MKGEERNLQLLTAGVKLATKVGAENVTRRDIARACKVSEPLVTQYLGSKTEIIKRLKAHAKKTATVLPDRKVVEAKGEAIRKKRRADALAKIAPKSKAARRPLPAPANAL